MQLNVLKRMLEIMTCGIIFCFCGVGIKGGVLFLRNNVHRLETVLPKTFRLRWNRRSDQGQEQEQEPQSDMAAWEAILDEASGSIYFWNSETGETRWDDPRAATGEPSAGMLIVQNPMASEDEGGVQLQILNSNPMHERGDERSSNWETIFDEESGKNYYYNKNTGETTWKKHEHKSRRSQTSRNQ